MIGPVAVAHGERSVTLIEAVSLARNGFTFALASFSKSASDLSSIESGGGAPRTTADRHFLELNPLGTIPLLVHGNNRMTESAAICQHLCSLKQPTSLQVEPDEAEYGSYLNTLHFGEATLTFSQTLVLRYSRFEPEERRQPVVAADYARWFPARLRTLEVRLAQEDYLCAGRFTAVDISVGYALMLADYLDLSSRFTPAVTAYWERLQGRTAFRRSLEVQKTAALAQRVSIAPAPLTVPE